MTKTLATGTSLLGLMSALALLPTVARAQDAATDNAALSDEIVVTAQRRAEASRDVPISVTTLSSDQLAVANVNSLSDTAKLTPGLRFDTQGPAMQPTIRGVGTAITTSGGGPNVGIYVDGFFNANTYTSDFNLTKVQNIQVLKGPQGTLFGRNTTGGAIIVTTADPSIEPGAEFKASYGRYNALTLQGYTTFGLGDKVAIDLEGLYRSGDGFQKDVLGGRKHVGQYESWSVRAGAKIELGENASLLLRYIHQNVDDPTSQLVNAFVDKTGQAGFFDKVSTAGRAFYGRTDSTGLPLVYYYAPAGTFATKPGEIALDARTSFRAKSDTAQATLKIDAGFADIVSYTQYRKDHTPYYGDLDATALPFFGILVDVHDKTFSQEFVASSKPGGPLQWTAGLNYFEVKDTWDIGASFGGSPIGAFGGSSTKTKSYAAFADVTYELAQNFFLTAGARYSHDVVGDAYFLTNGTPVTYEDVDGTAVPTAGLPNGTVIPVDTLKNNSLTPRVVLRWKPSEDSSIYGSFTRGYKAGILNVGGLSKVPVKPEKINAFEVGYKYDDRTLAIDLAGYYYDYKDLQVSSYSNGAAQIRNAASSEIYGAEAQVRYRVSQALTLTGGAAWTHARYKSFPNAPYYTYCDPASAAGGIGCVDPALGGFGPGGLTQTTTDASGFKMQRAPDFTANLGASYGIDLNGSGKITLSGNVYYTSSFFFDPAQQFKQKPYELLSLRAQWEDPSERFTLAVYGDNVTNRRYQTQVLFNTLGTGSVWSSPTTYGVSLGAKF